MKNSMFHKYINVLEESQNRDLSWNFGSRGSFLLPAAEVSQYVACDAQGYKDDDEKVGK